MAEANVTKKNKVGFIKRCKSFFVETKSELKKATWPSKKQLIHNTGVILVFIIVVSIILFLLDMAFSGLVSKFTELF